MGSAFKSSALVPACTSNKVGRGVPAACSACECLCQCCAAPALAAMHAAVLTLRCTHGRNASMSMPCSWHGSSVYLYQQPHLHIHQCYVAPIAAVHAPTPTPCCSHCSNACIYIRSNAPTISYLFPCQQYAAPASTAMHMPMPAICCNHAYISIRSNACICVSSNACPHANTMPLPLQQCM